MKPKIYFWVPDTDGPQPSTVSRLPAPNPILARTHYPRNHGPTPQKKKRSNHGPNEPIQQDHCMLGGPYRLQMMPARPGWGWLQLDLPNQRLNSCMPASTVHTGERESHESRNTTAPHSLACSAHRSRPWHGGRKNLLLESSVMMASAFQARHTTRNIGTGKKGAPFWPPDHRSQQSHGKPAAAAAASRVRGDPFREGARRPSRQVTLVLARDQFAPGTNGMARGRAEPRTSTCRWGGLWPATSPQSWPQN